MLKLLAQLIGLLCILTVPAFVGTVKAGEPDEREAICADAQARFEAMNDLPPEAPGTVHVLMLKYTFCPSPLSVKAGTTVRFINVEKRTSRSVWFKDAGRPESDRLFPIEYWEETFETPGKFPYLCGPHWEQNNMKGFLDVTE